MMVMVMMKMMLMVMMEMKMMVMMVMNMRMVGKIPRLWHRVASQTTSVAFLSLKGPHSHLKVCLRLDNKEYRHKLSLRCTMKITNKKGHQTKTL